jgi:hypothetical protein
MAQTKFDNLYKKILKENNLKESVSHIDFLKSELARISNQYDGVIKDMMLAEIKKQIREEELGIDGEHEERLYNSKTDKIYGESADKFGGGLPFSEDELRAVAEDMVKYCPSLTQLVLAMAMSKKQHQIPSSHKNTDGGLSNVPGSSDPFSNLN